MTPEMRDRFLEDCEAAIRGQNLSLDLQKVTLRMRLGGLSQEQAYEIIQSARGAVTGSNFLGDDPREGIICEVIDGVVGCCAPGCHIWAPEFDTESELRKIENH